MKYQVWYMTRSFLRGIVGNSPDPNNLSATRVHLKDIEAGRTLKLLVAGGVAVPAMMALLPPNVKVHLAFGYIDMR